MSAAPFRLRFVRRIREAHATDSFYFDPEPALRFTAGQYLLCTLPHTDPDDRGIERAFTIASAPTEPLVRLTTRLSPESSTFKYALMGLAPGATLEANGPHGDFIFDSPHAQSVFIAGGIGITPFRAMLGDLAQARPRPRITLLYSNSTPDLPFRAFLDSLIQVQSWPELDVVYTVTRPSLAWDGPTGRIDAEFIDRYVPDPASATFYVCGPSPMVESVQALLMDGGVQAGRVVSEGFPGYEATAARLAR